MLFSILLGGSLLLLSSLVLENKLNKEVELTIQQKKTKYLTGKVTKTPWSISISQKIKPVLNKIISYDIPELLYLSQNLWESKVHRIGLKIDIGKMEQSLSNADGSRCSIDFRVPDKDYLLTDEKKEMNFIVLHEVAHCYIGKEQLKNPVQWLELSYEQTQTANNLYKNQEDLFFKYYCEKCEIKSRVVSPAVVYHELLADAYATNWILSIEVDKIDLDSVQKKRTLDFIHNPLQSNHPSHFVIKDIVKDFEVSGKLSDEKINKITQKAFFEYLQEMPFHYDKLDK